ncbi:MAG: hypothetical protein R3A46_15310 [Thermomicrobiales bacterium]
MAVEPFLECGVASSALLDERRMEWLENGSAELHPVPVVDQLSGSQCVEVFLKCGGFDEFGCRRRYRVFRDGRDIDVKLIPEQAGHRRVGTGQKWIVEECRQQRQGADIAALLTGRPRHQLAEVAEVPGSPAVGRVQAVQGRNVPQVLFCSCWKALRGADMRKIDPTISPASKLELV